jgi:hypothetical protein
MSGNASVWVAAAPDDVYAAVTDLPRRGEWSPENRGGEWLDRPDDGLVGATFCGRNGIGDDEWEATVTVSEAEPGRCFAFCVATPGEDGTMWRYTFEPVRDGTLVTESFEWHWTPTPDEGFRGRVGRLPLAVAVDAVVARERRLQQGVDATVQALKRALEDGT